MNGVPVPVEPKAFDLLVFLIRNRERAVSKVELQDELWPGVIVTEAALTRCVMKARKAIGDSTEEPAIKTLHGHGYRFSIDVTTTGPEAKLSSDPGGQPSLAVLPFSNLSDDSAQAYFSEGITEDIITELSRFKSLTVIARHSSFSYRDREVRISQIGRELNVSYVVDGSVQKAADRIRINARLIETSSETQIWSERYDRELVDVLVLQDELASTIAATVGGRVDASRGRKRVSDETLAAYDHVLRAQALYYEVDKIANSRARQHLEQAISIDPDNARATGLLAAVHSIDSWSFWSEDPAHSQTLSRELGKRSISLDDTDSLTHAFYAEILFDCEQYEQAESHFQKALSLNHNDIAARALYASKLAASGRTDEALHQLKTCERLDPFGLVWLPWIKATVLLCARRYDESVAAFRRIHNPPNAARLEFAAALALAGDTQLAREQMRLFLEVARREMPTFPGESLAGWVPLLPRFIDFTSPDDKALFVHALELAGLK